MNDLPIASTPDALFEEAQRIRPKWNDDGDDADERHARAQALFVRAAEGGHIGALEELASGGEGCFPWAVRLARLGDVGPLVSALTNGDHPVELSREVLAAARDGEPWAQLAVASVYDLGMEYSSTGVLVATEPDGFGWLPAAADPSAEARRWAGAAVAAGFAPAALWCALADRLDAPERALGSLAVALAAASELLPGDQEMAKRWLPKLLEWADHDLPLQIAARRLRAASGDAEAQAWLGDRHRLGEGVEADAAVARSFYEPAAAAGDVDACRELASMIEAGLGGPTDDDRARELYERAAELGGDVFSRQRLAQKYGLTWYALAPDEQ